MASDESVLLTLLMLGGVERQVNARELSAGFRTGI
jgi:hypothetical protein